jgi:uncharacterized membrane protein YbhN (UPF0104 family)
MFKSVIAFFRDDSHKARNIKWLITAITFCVLVGVALIIVPWAKTFQVLRGSDLAMILFSLLLTIPYLLLLSLSYYIIAEKQNASLGFFSLFKTNIIMIFYDIVLPSTFFVSGLRWYKYNQYSKKPAQTLTSIAYLKAYNILLTLLLSTGLLFFFNDATVKSYTLGIAGLIVACGLIIYLTPIISRSLLIRTDRIKPRETDGILKKNFYKYLRKLLSAFAEFRNLTIKTQVLLVIIVIASQGLQYVQYILFAESVGIHLTFAQLGVLRATILVIANLPINFSVGISLRDVTLVSLLVINNVPLEQAIAMSITILIKTYFFGLVGAVLEGVDLVKSKLSANSVRG